ncbi:MAG: CopG family transcriptional regulator [Desulfobacterales bacterium]
MANVKTAISIEKPVFEQMDDLAKNLKISRSRLFAIAAREFLQRHENRELLKMLDDVYRDSGESESVVDMMRPHHHKLVKDQW